MLFSGQSRSSNSERRGGKLHWKLIFFRFSTWHGCQELAPTYPTVDLKVLVVRWREERKKKLQQFASRESVWVPRSGGVGKAWLKRAGDLLCWVPNRLRFCFFFRRDIAKQSTSLPSTLVFFSAACKTPFDSLCLYVQLGQLLVFFTSLLLSWQTLNDFFF